MKRMLLLFCAMSYSFASFCQSENKGIKKQTKIYTLEEVYLIANKVSTKTHEISCRNHVGTITKISCGTYCTVSGVLFDEAFTKNETTVKLFPNPSANGIFQLNFEEKYNKVKVVLHSISGQEIQSKTFQNVLNKTTIDLSDYPSGIYLINIIANGEHLSTKKAIRG